jgi:flagellar motility protein MotE (MotC chaperone)
VGPAVKKNPAATHHTLTEKDLEAHLKKKMGMRPSKKSPNKIPWKLAGMSLLGLILAAGGFLYHENLEKLWTRLEVGFVAPAQAQGAGEERKPAAVPAATPAPSIESTQLIETKEELDHLSKLKEKKRELEAREEEIARLEAEVNKQREELELRLKELKDTRESISRMLEERVKADDEKIDTLVQMYSNMRPPQAAKVFETLDEDLAIEILGRMKKKSAADIMNLLKPEKAQVFSEKFAGYKRK